jgi:hypothetical protein
MSSQPYGRCSLQTQQALRLNANDPLTPADRDRLNRALAALLQAQEKK